MPVDLPVPSLSSPNLDCVSGGSSTSPGQVAPLGPEQQQQQKVDDSPPPPTAPRIGCTSHPFVSPPPMLVIPFSPRFHQPGSRLNPQSTIPIPLLVMTPANTPGATEEDEKLDDYFPSITLPSFGKAPLGHGHRRLCRRKSSISSTVLLRLRGHRLSLASRSHLMPFGSVPADDPPVPPNLKNSPYLRSPLLSSSSSSSGPKFGNFPPGGSLTPNSSMVSSAGSIASSGSSTMLSPLSSPARRARNV
ncbi:uncharacterized protein EI90DRAFT_1717475 [Cantharellus anzutake]|uniref:uncharacterized protein n=1 Tax=Cantharellus anzutake TaxID=1750568 RepID=UPI00190540DD|nr:uncharacterized protein EI90DRAFT_1717475 [Cantharellus anzutake]KAF8341296.1 hypothetical protein EI90DRAFT_1717475 [Cantharellus anzutake]